jgi:hypothetical protein
MNGRKCCICNAPLDPWPGGGGFGHNPDPVIGMEALVAIANMKADFDYAPKMAMTALDGGRCCDWCNNNVVIPVRLARAGNRQLATAYPSATRLKMDG